jgi:hypothetical protein
MDHNTPVSPLLSDGQNEPPDNSRLSSSSTVKEQEVHARSVTTSLQQPSARLHRSSWALLLITIYTTLTLFSWIAICKAVKAFNQDTLGTDSYLVDELSSIRRRYEAARIIQSFVAIITIPMTSAICANAAVIFAQKKNRSNAFTLRQLLVLANESWANPSQWPRVANRWRSYGSSFVLGTTLLTILGASILPLQQAFLVTRIMRVTTGSDQGMDLFDMAGIVQPLRGSKDDNVASIFLRNALGTVDTHKPQSQLWEENYPPCANDNTVDCYRTGHPSTSNLINNFRNFSELYQPFFSELPNGFNTGLRRQFAPRINSTASYEAVSSFPHGCDQLPGAFFANYTNTIGTSIPSKPWAIVICMPADQRVSPWRATRDRQDFSESLYLNITYQSSSYTRDKTTDTTFKITVNTTAGYFELPNYSNGGVPGPLLLKDPLLACGIECSDQVPFHRKTRYVQITRLRVTQY